jgi:glycosyltransferase involved in cell wall biosynthesis
MNYLYISDFDDPNAGLGDYSNSFTKALVKIAETRKFTLEIRHYPGSCQRDDENLLNNQKESLLSYARKLASNDQIHIEICRNDGLRWQLLQGFIKDRLIVAQLNVTIHDPPEIIGQLMAPLSEMKTMPGWWWRPYYRKIWRRSPFAHAILQKSLQKIDRIYVLTQSGAESLCQCFNLKNTEVISIPHVQFNTKSEQGRDFKSLKSEYPVVGFMGAWWKHKGIEFAIEQLEELAIEGEEFEFWISGISRNKKYRKKIDYLLAQLKHSLRVKKFGLLATSEFRKFSEACDLIIFPYRTGWKVQASGILMRALEGGACVLTSDSPGPFDEAIQDNAVASFRWEHPEEFKNKVRWLLHSRDQRLYFREKSNQFLSKRHANELVTSKINQALETSN